MWFRLLNNLHHTTLKHWNFLFYRPRIASGLSAAAGQYSRSSQFRQEHPRQPVGRVQRLRPLTKGPHDQEQRQSHPHREQLTGLMLRPIDNGSWKKS